MRLNNKGFAISTIMYMVLVLAVLIMALTLTLLGGRKLIIDKQKQVALTNIYGNMSRPVDLFPVVFSASGPCKFNGYSGNITGDACQKYSNVAYINTGVQLFNGDNWEKDFEITFKIVEYSASNQTPDPVDNNNQHTILNSKFEDSSAKYPGFTFRRSTSGLELTSRNNEAKATQAITYSANMVVRIIRKNKKVYYNVNGSSFTLLQDFTNLYRQFTTPVTFGATIMNNVPRRLTNCTLADMTIRMGVMDDNYVTLP